MALIACVWAVPDTAPAADSVAPNPTPAQETPAASNASTNTPASTAKDPRSVLRPKSNASPTNAPGTLPVRGNVEIICQGGFVYEGESGRVVYSKKVKVFDPAEDPKTIIECDWLTTVLPPPGGRVGEIIALTNVVITIIDSQGLQIAKGAKATYNATNDTVIIEGSPVVEMPTGTLFGDQKIIYNRTTERFDSPGQIRMISRQGAALPGLAPKPTPPPSSPNSTPTPTPSLATPDKKPNP